MKKITNPILLIVLILIISLIGFLVVNLTRQQIGKNNFDQQKLLNRPSVSVNETIKPTKITLIKYEIVEAKSAGKPRIMTFVNEKGSLVKSNNYFNILKDRIISEGISAKNWFQDRCIEFWINERDDIYISIERHGYHQDGCPGDPMSSPLYDTFLINKKTKEIYYEIDISEPDRYKQPLDEWAKTISKE